MRIVHVVSEFTLHVLCSLPATAASQKAQTTAKSCFRARC